MSAPHNNLEELSAAVDSIAPAVNANVYYDGEGVPDTYASKLRLGGYTVEQVLRPGANSAREAGVLTDWDCDVRLESAMLHSGRFVGSLSPSLDRPSHGVVTLHLSPFEDAKTVILSRQAGRREWEATPMSNWLDERASLVYACGRLLAAMATVQREGQATQFRTFTDTDI